MDRKEFQNKMNQYKKAREENPQLSYWQWKMDLPDNLANTPDWEYNNIGAWSGGLQPTLEDDGYYHLGSRNPYTGEILKPKHHPTYQKAIESEIEAGYYPYEKNGVTYTKTYSPIGDLSGYADGTDGIEDPIEELKATARTTLTPYEQKQLMQDYAQYSKMSGSISPILDIQTAADFTPVGNVLMAKDIYDAASYNDYLTAGLLGAAMVVPPVISNTAKKFVPSFVTAAADKINALRNRERALKATRENIYQKAIEQRNRTIEDLYTNGAAWERAEAIKKAYGDDYPQAYRDVMNQYENDYFNLPEPVVKNYGESKAAMSAKKEAIDRYQKTGQPAGYGDFEYQIDDTLEGLDYPTTVHELGHYVDFNLAKSANPNKNNSLLNRIKGDLSVEPNRLFPDKTSYFRTGSEQKSYMNTLRRFMLDNNMIINEGDKVSTRKIRKAIDALPSDMQYVKGAYEQFKDPKLYTKWFNKIPLLGVPGAAMYLENKEDNSYVNGSDGIYDSLTKEQKKRVQYGIDGDVEGFDSSLIDKELTSEYGSMSFYAGELPEIEILPQQLYAQLNTYYPIVSKFPLTGHSEIITPQNQIITALSDDDDYNLFTKNCSDATKCALNSVLDMNIDPILFTTPGDVKDAVSNMPNIKTKYKDGIYTQYIPISDEQARKLEYEAYKRRIEANKIPNRKVLPYNEFIKHMSNKK